MRWKEKGTRLKLRKEEGGRGGLGEGEGREWVEGRGGIGGEKGRMGLGERGGGSEKRSVLEG